MMRDSQSLLLRALREGAHPAPPLRAVRSEAWASATFAGARHRFEFEPACAARANAFADALEATEFNLNGHLVADITVAARTTGPTGVALTVEALTVEDA